MERPIVKALLSLFTYRNQSPAFDLDGGIEVATPDENSLVITRFNTDKSVVSEVTINLKDLTYSVLENGQKVEF